MIALLYIHICAAVLAGQLAASASLPGPDDFTSHALRGQGEERISWHLDRHQADEAGPLIVFLAGSGSAPLFQSYADGSTGFNVPPALLAYMDRAHILLVDKPGVPFTAEVDWDERRQRPVFEPGPEFAAMTRQGLVRRNALAAREALDRLGDLVTHVILIGYSEGGQFVFELARELPATTHAVAIGGNALPQWYDFVIEARLAAERGEISRPQAQERIETLYSAMRQVRSQPEGGATLYGHDFRRWASFGPYAPIDDMLALDLPLLMIQGGADVNAPILNTDYGMIAFLNAGKSNLTYWVYPDYDHFLTEPDPDHPDRRIDRAQEVFERLWSWIYAEADPNDPKGE